jgi:small-conductance mechanosensitive channel
VLQLQMLQVPAEAGTVERMVRELDWPEWLRWKLFGDPLHDWGLAIALAVVSFSLFLVVKRFLVVRIGRRAERTETPLDNVIVDLVRRTRPLLLLFPAIYLGSMFLEITATAHNVLRVVTIVALLIQVGIWASVGMDLWTARYRRLRLEEDASSVMLIGALSFITKLVLWSVLMLLALANMGVDVTALVAGLGVGGIAIALALQNVLGDLLASLSIVLDKPFIIGETITVGEFTGTVENIGLKTTRIRSLTGEQLVFPNGDILQSRIRNWKRMVERRVVQRFGVTYQTPPEKVERIPKMVREIVEAQEDTRFDRAHFFQFGDSSLDFEVVFYILSPEFALHMDRRQAVNLALMRAFAAEGIDFAYPTRTLWIERGGAADGPSSSTMTPRAGEGSGTGAIPSHPGGGRE